MAVISRMHMNLTHLTQPLQKNRLWGPRRGARNL